MVNKTFRNDKDLRDHLVQDLANSFCNGPDCKYFGSVAIWCLYGNHSNPAVLAQEQPETMGNEWSCCAPLTLYLWTQKFELHIIFTCEMFFSFPQPFKNIKTILSSQAIKNRCRATCG